VACIGLVVRIDMNGNRGLSELALIGTPEAASGMPWWKCSGQSRWAVWAAGFASAMNGSAENRKKRLLRAP